MKKNKQSRDDNISILFYTFSTRQVYVDGEDGVAREGSWIV
jgi:hypothetical protein